MSAVGGINSVTTAGIDTTGANLIVIGISYSNVGGTVPTLTDSKGNTWTALTARPLVANGVSRLYYCFNPTVGAGHTFSNTGVNNFSTIFVEAFSGAASSPFDQENGATNAVADTIATGNVTPSIDNEVVITHFMYSVNGTPTVDSGFIRTDYQDFSSGNNYGGAMAYSIQTTATTVNPTWIEDGTVTGIATTIATFKAVVAGSSPSPSASASPSAAVGYTVVQTAIDSSGKSIDTIALAFDQEVTTGNMIFVGTNNNNETANSVGSVTDSLGNTYTKIISTTDNDFVETEAWFTISQYSGINTIYVTFVDPSNGNALNNVDCGIAIREYSGVSTVSPLDKSVAKSVTSGTSHTSGNTAATTQADELVIGFGATNGAGSDFTAGSGYSNFNNNGNNASGIEVALEDKIVHATGVQAATMTTSGSDNVGMICATFKLA